jgi:hypothetical protein
MPALGVGSLGVYTAFHLGPAWRFQASLGPMGEWADGRMGMAV